MKRICQILFLLGTLAGFEPCAQAQYYEYDAAGRLTLVAYPQGGGIAYTYDEADNMTAAMPLSLPAAPSTPQVTRVDAVTARVVWEPSEGATGYVVERRQVGASGWEEVARLSGNTTTYIDPSLAEGADYEYRVSALSADGRSAPSAEAGFVGLPAPSLSQNGVLNGASFVAGQAIAPGAIVSLFGQNLGVRLREGALEPSTSTADSVPLPLDLGGYSVRFGGEEAPLFFVGGQQSDPPGEISGQINAQVPWETPLGSAQVAVRRDNADTPLESAVITVPVAAVSPAVFTFDFGPGRAAALNIQVDTEDDVIKGSIAQPAGAFPGVASQPAKLGGVVTLFANGLGPVDPPAVSGQASLDELRAVTLPVRVLVGGAEAQVLFAGLTPQFVGLYQINVVIPLGAAPGDAVPVLVEQGGLASRDDVTIALRP